MKHSHREMVKASSLKTFKVKWGSEQPDLVKNLPALCRALGLHGL